MVLCVCSRLKGRVGFSSASQALAALGVAFRALYAAASHPVCSKAALGGGLPERLVHHMQEVQHPQHQLLERKTSFNEGRGRSTVP